MDTQHNSTQNSIFRLCIINAQCRKKTFMLSVIMLSVIMLNVIMLNVIMLNVIMLNVMLNVITMNVIMLNVTMLNVVAPIMQLCSAWFLHFKI